MARSKRQRLGLVRRYTFKLDMNEAQEEAVREHCRIVALLWNACLQRNEDVYAPLAKARHEFVWHQYKEPVKRRDGTLVYGKYVKRHLAHADRLHSDPDARKLSPDERLRLFGSAKMTLNLFDLTPEITQVRRQEGWFAMSKYSLLRVAKAQEEAFGAFFKRAKAGLGGQSGYPRYRRVSQANWLPHMFASGCKLVPSTGSSHRKWRLRLKGVPGRIRAYGKFPKQPLAWLDADIREHDGTWWLSVCVEVPPRRDPGEASGEIRFDLVDTFAEVRGNLPEPPKWSDILLLQDQMDRLKSERDTRYPRKPGTKPSRNWQKMTRRIGRLSAEIARKRRERLHEWTTAVVAQSSDLEIVAPPVKEVTRTAKGTEKNWGAAVEIVAKVNRHVLSQAPAAAVQMLKYKAEEAGVRVNVVDDAGSPKVAIGRDLSTTVKSVRKARRKLRKDRNNEDRSNA